jgi:hypothetical protein
LQTFNHDATVENEVKRAVGWSRPIKPMTKL